MLIEPAAGYGERIYAPKQLFVIEIVPGMTLDELQVITKPKLTLSPGCKDIALPDMTARSGSAGKLPQSALWCGIYH